MVLMGRTRLMITMINSWIILINIIMIIVAVQVRNGVAYRGGTKSNTSLER